MPIGKQLLHDRISARITALLDQPDGIDLVPVVAYYGTERAVTSEVLMRVDWLPDIRSPRLKSLAGALDARTQFGDTFSWFRSLLERESQARMERGELIYQLPEAQAVRQALERALPGCTNPRIDLDPPRFMIDFRRGEAVEVLHLGQLSDGYRIYLALVMDLARRMLQANPPPQPPHTRTFGLEAPALVLIDEIDLHLHPRWQQTVVPPLLDIFPRTQFLITTHSEQVLSSLPSDALVLELEQQGDGLRITQPALRLHGALAEQVLEQVLDVPPRPPSQYSTDLARYLELIDQGQGEMPEALALRSKLEPIRPDDPDLTRADLRIQRQKLFANKPRRPDAPPKQGKS